LTLVFGASADKDIHGMLHALVPPARRVVVTRAPNVRAADPEAVAAAVDALGVTPEISHDPNEALARALEGAGADDVIVVTGSIFVIGAIGETWQQA
jgi:dihydrofolate synthase/folylpolyglutamate synthase